nr:AMP-binding protein [Solimonas terrae]
MLSALQSHACTQPDRIALDDGRGRLSYGELLPEVEKLAAQLRFLYIGTLALHADNGIGWVVTDLAALVAGIRCVPLPRFFSDAQLRHVLRDSGADALLADDDRLAALPDWQCEPQAICGMGWRLARRTSASGNTLPDRVQKISYSCGANGVPRRICLGVDSQIALAVTLMQTGGKPGDDSHRCVLPLSTLIENIGGVYASLLAGASVCVPGLAALDGDDEATTGSGGSGGRDATWHAMQIFSGDVFRAIDAMRNAA